MSPFTLGTRNLLERQLYQFLSATYKTLPNHLLFSSLRLGGNGHRLSSEKSTPQVCMKNRPFQLRKRWLSFSSSLAMIGLPDSKRTPWMDFNSNPADVIEKHMLNRGCRIWGLVIYRCTYKSDADWEELMSRLLYKVRSPLEEYYDGLDILDSFRPTVMDDRTRFDGATPDNIRDHFNEWAPMASETEQGISSTDFGYDFIARYRFCIMVDEEALRSVLAIPRQDLDGDNRTGFVMLVNSRHFKERASIEESNEKIEDDDCEPLYGCTWEDVGWMKVWKLNRIKSNITCCQYVQIHSIQAPAKAQDSNRNALRLRIAY
ncbi:hypothetical protein BO82DRAFT_384515 [Aspergillus uvarum CBS 121591]|uniref:Uncharacterized protein n=1 Tax=Aspergillus uvarum CBS 121591 TaxID=1448315 RepID=A0A319DLD4_9EURO|nr:hypothetical protein BO82DRAFT_384515 [Aspergillus uvarum CBS 121591]PYH80262.1 hypothetical protein BO82DRAFT_384515 [Aspergillus uvarum CBS 121591]